MHMPVFACPWAPTSPLAHKHDGTLHASASWHGRLRSSLREGNRMALQFQGCCIPSASWPGLFARGSCLRFRVALKSCGAVFSEIRFTWMAKKWLPMVAKRFVPSHGRSGFRQVPWDFFASALRRGYMMLGTLVAVNDVPLPALSCVVIFTGCAWILARPALDDHSMQKLLLMV